MNPANLTLVELGSYQSLIKDRCGLQFVDRGEDKLSHAIGERIARLASRASDYFALLSRSQDEFQELINLLTINETYFFREPEQIRLLVNRLAPRLLARGGAPVRILSAGCSSGEEPYSLVMALMDKYGDSVDRLFHFVAGDIDSAVLAKARQGRYSEFSFRGVEDSVRSRYFEPEARGYVLKEAVRKRVSFHELNLLAPKVQAELTDFDIIFFRNVSIYFDRPTCAAIQHNLASLMRDDGILVIGTAETLANDLGVLPMVEEDGLFYFIKGKPHLDETPASIPWFNLAPIEVATEPAFVEPFLPSVPTMQPADLGLARMLAHESRHDEALPILDSFLANEPSHLEALLLKAHALINRKDFMGAEMVAQKALAIDAWSIDAFLLLGLAAKWSEKASMAIHWFKQAAYSCHECWSAHYYLGELYRQVGELDAARRAYRSTMQLLSSGVSDSCIRFVPLGLGSGEIRFLCAHHLAKLDPVPPGKKSPPKPG